MDTYMVPSSMTEREYREDRSYSVWTWNFSEEWLGRNGIPDMVIVGGISLHAADLMVCRLKLINPHMNYTIKDGRGVAIDRPISKES